MPTVSEATRKRIRDYIVSEPSFTVAFAAWELGINRASIDVVMAEEALPKGWVRQIEPRSGPWAAVYQYDPPSEATVHRLPLPELDAGIRPDLAPARGEPVAHTGGKLGPSGRPGRDRKRQEAGFHVKRARQGT